MDAIAERERWASFNPVEEKGIESVLLKDQQFVVYQSAHAESLIKSPDGNPWIRVVGFTDSLQNARDLARSAHDMGNKTETRIMPCGRNFLIGRTRYAGLDLDRREVEQKKSNALVDAHIASRQAVFEKHRTSQAEHSQAEQAEQQAEQEVILPSAPLVEPPSILTPVADPGPAPGQVPHVMMQRYFAMAIVPDSDDSLREPSIVALFAMDSEADIREYLKSAAKSKDLVHFDILVGATAEWLPLYKARAEKTLHHHPLRQDLEDHIRFE